MENENISPSRKNKRRIWPVILLTFCFMVSAAAGALLASSSLFDLRKEPILPIERVNFDTELIKAKNKSTILIMGVDVREDDVGRSDTLMIATVDPKYDQAALLSIPRDTRVRIYGYGYDKINAAYAYGGEPLAEKTVENFLGIDIDHYVIINTNSFVKIIDAIGGIDIDVEKRMKYEDPWDDNGGLVINLFPGLQHMDGKKAVTYVRYRDSEGDIGRIERQQKFIEACLAKVTSPSFIPRIPAVIHEIMDAIDTDMTFRQLLELAGALKAAQENGLKTDMVPGYPLYIDEISYWIPYIDELQYAMAKLLDVSVDSKIKSRVEKVANEYNESLPSNAREIPEGAENIGSSRRNSSSYDDIDSRRSDEEEDSNEDRRSTYDDERSIDEREPARSREENPSRRYNESRSNYYYDGERRYEDRHENYYYDSERRPSYEESRSNYYYDGERRVENELPSRYDDRREIYEENYSSREDSLDEEETPVRGEFSAKRR